LREDVEGLVGTLELKYYLEDHEFSKLMFATLEISTTNDILIKLENSDKSILFITSIGSSNHACSLDLSH